DVTLKMPAFEWVHVQLHQQKGMISLSPPTICNSAHLNEAIIALKMDPSVCCKQYLSHFMTSEMLSFFRHQPCSLSK
ncbi:hypothetical protein, partial [Escherichia coli]|uniref:hypothetical protein n=1 Tax=Escherichia coli TaxID=562 RepID=UPI0025412745